MHSLALQGCDMALIFTLAFLCLLAVLYVYSAHVQLRARRAQRAEQKHLVLQQFEHERMLDPRLLAKVEAERRYELASRELHIREWQAYTQVAIAQYGMLVREEVAAPWTHVAPIHKPLSLKPGEQDQAAIAGLPGMRTFSEVLTSFHPTLERLLLGYLPGEVPALASAEGLCHVALAGATGNGKSVLVRLLLAQLCFVGADVLLLNPHYTRYDLRSKEDWTPFEPYLFDNPMRCKDYQVIAGYLRMAAEEMLPTRLDRYSRSLPVGKPFYIVLDELPAIVKHVPEAPGYMADLLREGRKVGLFLVTAAQDFLVKTIMGSEGGAVRDCFRTAVYVGGDAQTARVLLDVKGTVDDGGLGQGVVMLRAASVKQASLARVPYVDNESLYQLLGPSTYAPIVESSLESSSEMSPVPQSLESGQQEGSNEVRNEVEPALQAKLEQVRTLMQSGVLNKADVIQTVWGAKAGSGAKYKQAEAEWKQVMAAIAAK